MHNDLRFAMIILLQQDVEEAINFYTKIGCQIQFHLPSQWAEGDFGGIKIGLAQTKEELPQRRTGIVFEVPDLRAWCSDRAQEGISCFAIVEQIHGLMSGFIDPGNNIIELYQPTPEKVKMAVDQSIKQA